MRGLPGGHTVPGGWIELLGLIAGACTTVAFLPQVTKTLRTRQTRDLSAGMVVLFSLGVALWLVYGLLIHSLPVILSNGATLALALVLVWFKLRGGDSPSNGRGGD